MSTPDPLRSSYIEQIDHVGIAVRDLEVALSFYEAAFNTTVVHREHVEHDGVDEALLDLGGSYLQLLTPTSSDSPVARFLDRRGEGLHHVAYRVQSCAEALAHLHQLGCTTVDAAPRPGSRGTLVAFVHPRSALGTLIELVEEPTGSDSLAAVTTTTAMPDRGGQGR